MNKRTKLLLAALTAMLVLALGASVATALRSLAVTGGERAITATVRQLVFTSGFVNERCDVTLGGRVKATAAKNSGVAVVGEITEGRTANCTNNLGITPTSATPLVEARNPWRVLYRSIAGTLPAITEVGLTLENSQFLIRVGAETSCLYKGNVVTRTAGRAGRAELTVETMIGESGSRVALFRHEGEEFFRTCSANGTLGEQVFAVSPAFTVTLL